MPSTPIPVATLIQSCVVAVLLAAIALVCLILPAEYNVDPTGVGQALGLTQLAQVAETSTSAPQTAGRQTHRATVTVPAGQGVEYKFQMNQHATLSYQWLSNGLPLYVDLHGEPAVELSDQYAPGYFQSYAVATVSEMTGSVTAPFDGSHGWYWKNSGDVPVVVQLKVVGEFSLIGLK